MICPIYIGRPLLLHGHKKASLTSRTRARSSNRSDNMAPVLDDDVSPCGSYPKENVQQAHLSHQSPWQRNPLPTCHEASGDGLMAGKWDFNAPSVPPPLCS